MAVACESVGTTNVTVETGPSKSPILSGKVDTPAQRSARFPISAKLASVPAFMSHCRRVPVAS